MESPANLDPPFSIPEHEIIRQIGSGACGEVWLARSKLGVYRAVKIIRLRDGAEQNTFKIEFAGIVNFEPISRLHDGFVDILQVGGSVEDGYFYYVMELADDVATGQAINPQSYAARTLSHDMRARGRLPIGECIRLGAAMASALGFLHRKNLTHRDLKPSNIIFINGFPKLADIGLVAGLSKEHEYIGTVGFIPPEGFGTARADLYSLGKVLYEMGTGNPADQYPAPPPDLRGSREDLEWRQFNRIIAKACRSSPHLRYRSSDELMTALLSFQFNPDKPQWDAEGSPMIRTIGVIGAISGAGFLIFLVWRLVWLLQHEQQ